LLLTGASVHQWTPPEIILYATTIRQPLTPTQALELANLLDEVLQKKKKSKKASSKK